MRQLVNIKKVSVDSELKVSVVVEFIASDRDSKENVFNLIELQGDVVEASFVPAQKNLQFEKAFEGAIS
ncbi:MAG: hypothetical protein QW561_05110 [Candidatus Aenigmatarchaeota archaeon]